jgi:hypothetical protein
MSQSSMHPADRAESPPEPESEAIQRSRRRSSKFALAAMVSFLAFFVVAVLLPADPGNEPVFWGLLFGEGHAPVEDTSPARACIARSGVGAGVGAARWA